jgi:hypothetical protein
MLKLSAVGWQNVELGARMLRVAPGATVEVSDDEARAMLASGGWAVERGDGSLASGPADAAELPQPPAAEPALSEPHEGRSSAGPGTAAPGGRAQRRTRRGA